MTINPILNTDSYKASHFRQYPAGPTNVFSYVEARGGADERALFFGLQAILKAEFNTPVTRADIGYGHSFANIGKIHHRLRFVYAVPFRLGRHRTGTQF